MFVGVGRPKYQAVAPPLHNMVPLDHAMYKYYLYTARCTLFFGHKWNGTIRSVYHNFAHALLFVSCDKLDIRSLLKNLILYSKNIWVKS